MSYASYGYGRSALGGVGVAAYGLGGFIAHALARFRTALVTAQVRMARIFDE